MPRDVVRIDLDTIFTKDDRPEQVRDLNYVFSFDVIDTETGAMIMENEYRTIASDVELNLDEMKSALTSLIETEQT